MFKIFQTQILVRQEKKEFKEAMERLISDSTMDTKFLLFTMVSSMIATIGIVTNNVTILIGAMLIAPLLIPIIGLSVGVGAGSLKLIGHSLKSLGAGFILALLSSILITLLIAPSDLNREIYAGFSETFLYSLVAFLSGVLGVYSWFKPGTNQIIPGVAIAVALVPPIAFMGTIIVLRNQYWLLDVTQLVFFNMIGIFLGGLLTFLIFSILSKRPTRDVHKQVEDEVEKKTK